MSTTPTITTARTILRPFSDAHLTAEYVEWLNDPETVRFSELRHRRHDTESCRDHVAGLRAGGHHFWAIELRAGPHTHIGNITAYLDTANRTAETSILIGHSPSRGQGLGREAWCAVVDHLLQVETFRLVHAGTMSANTGMLRAFEESGMTTEGRSVGRFLLDGKPVDMVLAARHATQTPSGGQ